MRLLIYYCCYKGRICKRVSSKSHTKKKALRIHNFTPYAKYGYGKTRCEQNTGKMYKWKLVKPVTFLIFSFDWLVLTKIKKTCLIASKEGEPGFLADNEETVMTVGNYPAFKYLLIIFYPKIKGSCCQACFENWSELVLSLMFSRLSKLHPKGVEIRAVIATNERSSDESKLHSLIPVDNKKN